MAWIFGLSLMVGTGIGALRVIGLNFLENEPREFFNEQAAGFRG
jgi:hypothetical protein